ncbi:hypothetical protein GGI21_002359, partial [Coemansia aciculifera]
MDDILQTLKLEVTLDCLQGSSLSQMWSYVELAQRRLLQRNGMESESVSVDDSMKRYLWPHILNLPEMSFINEGSVVHDSTASVDSSTPSLLLSLSVDEVESQFPGLIVRASLKAIYKEIFGREEGNERLIRSAQSFALIQGVARSRERGISQVQLSKAFGLDPRSTFHYIKNIDREGLLAKCVTFDQGTTTNLWVLRRFAPEKQDIVNEAAPLGSRSIVPAPDSNDNGESLTAYLVSHELRKRITDVLQATGGGYMVDIDLMDALKLEVWDRRQRKYFQRVLRSLIKDGYVEQAELPIQDAVLPPDLENKRRIMALDKAKSGDKAKKTREVLQFERVQRERVKRGLLEGYSYRRCVRFLKPYVEKTKARVRLGVPLEHSTEQRPTSTANVATPNGDEGLGVANTAESDDEADEDSCSSDEDEPDIDAIKEKGDLRYMTSTLSVQIGDLALLSPEAQVLRLIALSGAHGIVSKAIQIILKWGSLRSLYRCLCRMEQTPVFLPNGSWPGVYTSEECKQVNIQHLSQPLVEAAEEFMGREHRKRYFINPKARMAVLSLTAHVYVPAAQQPTTVLPRVVSLSASSGVGTALAAAPARMDSQAICADLRQPDAIVELAERGPAESQAAASESESAEATVPSAAELAEVAEARLVVEDMVAHITFGDMFIEAKTRKVPLNNVVREYVMLAMLKRELVFTCNSEHVVRCDRTIKEYVRANMDSPSMTATLTQSLLGHSMDKRTFERSVRVLADQKRLWFQTVNSLPDISGPNSRAIVHLVIDRDTDPNGAYVRAYIAQLRDTRRYNKQNLVVKRKRIQDVIPVIRTDGADERDRDFLVRKLDTEKSRALGLKNYNKRTERIQTQGGSSKPKQTHDEDGNRIIKRARVILLEKRKRTGRSEALTEWQTIEKRLVHIPRRIGRLKDLYDHLVHNLAVSVDNDCVFENYAFRSSYLFYRLPLELFMELTGGISYFDDIVPYIRDGACTWVDGRSRRGGGKGGLVSNAQDKQASSPESINMRLRTPLYMLPPDVVKLIDARITKTRAHLQSLIYGLYILQLIRPIETVREITS